MRFRLSRLLVPLTLVVSSSAAVAAPKAGDAARSSPRARKVVDGAVTVAFGPRQQTYSIRTLRPQASAVPVVVKLSRPVRASDLEALAAAGAREVEGFGGMSGLPSRLALAEVPLASLSAIEALDGVERVSLDGPLFPAPRPLEHTAAMVQASDVWRASGADGLAIDGHGITICDIDSGVDPFHPLFFRADGNGGKPYLPWIDVDGDGALTPGVDGIDIDGDGVITVLRVLNSTVTQIWDDTPMFGSEDPALDPGFDYLYADVNANGLRDQGPAAGFTEQSPTYGEQLFLVDDVDHDGVVRAGEKLVALGTSKLKAVRWDKKIYRRGQNLIDVPWEPHVDHGTGASGVLVGGTIGLTRHVGMAPGADLVVVSNRDETPELKLAKVCTDEGARVVLHEYAPWYGHPLDGSSSLEAFIDATSAMGVVHVNPAGNLSGSEKLYKNDIPAGATTDVLVEVPAEWGFTFFGATFLWRDPTRDLSLVLEDPSGNTKEIGGPNLVYEEWGGLTLYADRIDSDRGTARVDLYLFNETATPKTIEPGTWKIHVTDPSPAGGAPLTLIGYVADELSGWGKGIYFPEHTSEEHFIGHPGTADHGMPIAAFTGNGYWGAPPGERAPYSGRGVRIDGEPILWISAPDDPITAGTRAGVQSLHIIYGGTSGASPHVAGGAALLLSQNPTATGDDVKEAIRKSALADEAVLSAGPVPNTDYGHGKLRIHEALFGGPPPGGSAPTLTIAPVTLEEGETATLVIEPNDADEPAAALTLEIDHDYDGVYDEELASAELSVEGTALGTFVSKVRVTDSTGRSASALAYVSVVEKGTLHEPEPDPVIEVGGGGGCSVTAPLTRGSAASLSGGLALGLLGALGVSRRRRRAASSGVSRS